MALCTAHRYSKGWQRCGDVPVPQWQHRGVCESCLPPRGEGCVHHHHYRGERLAVNIHVFDSRCIGPCFSAIWLHTYMYIKVNQSNPEVDTIHVAVS